MSDFQPPPSYLGSVSPAHAAEIRDCGFTVIDGFFGQERAAALREEAMSAAHNCHLPEHKFQFGSSLFVKPHIYEADLHDEALREDLPEFADLFFEDGLAQSLASQLPELGVESGPSAKTLKVHYNNGSGGCFPWHYDNAGRPSKRSITCIVYLNPSWKDGDGGELALQPFLKPEVVIPPLMDRAVIFRSDRILHRVYPSSAERFCLTIWLDGKCVNSDSDCNLTARHLTDSAEVLESFSGSPVQRSVSRAVYAEAYERSLRECMTGAPGFEEMLKEHQLQIEKQQTHPQLGPFLERLRALTFKAAGETAIESCTEEATEDP